MNLDYKTVLSNWKKSYGQAIKAVGSNKNLPEEVKSLGATLYHVARINGIAIQTLATSMKVPRGTFSGWKSSVLNNDITNTIIAFRIARGATVSMDKPTRTVAKQLVKSLHKNNATNRQIGSLLGISPSTVHELT